MTTTHQHDLRPWTHSHTFHQGNPRGEQRTRWVLAVTVLTMGFEIGAGWWTGSLALLADGWHMGTHALALGVATWAYGLSRRHAQDSRYAFGTWKIEVLGSFASALALAMVAGNIAFESIWRLTHPQALQALDALVATVIGLVVNLVCVAILHGAQGHDNHHHHGHGHAHAPHDHDHSQGGQDLNLRAVYTHVLADALTSVLAIVALAGALWQGWQWLDPAVGLLGAIVIAVWAWGLLRQSSAVLLDREMDHPLLAQIRSLLENDGDTRVADLHVWRIGRAQFSAMACVVADRPLSAMQYRTRLAPLSALVHLAIEVNQCPDVQAADSGAGRVA
jgi:cation diffusion facilitator family transporter